MYVWYCDSIATHARRAFGPMLSGREIAQILEGFHDREALPFVQTGSSNFAIHDNRSVYSKECVQLQDGNPLAKDEGSEHSSFLGGFR
jgi:hypothetical protein